MELVHYIILLAWMHRVKVGSYLKILLLEVCSSTWFVSVYKFNNCWFRNVEKRFYFL